MKERPSLHALAIFLAVLEHETMTAAAEAEGMSQPAISMHIKTLEGFLGVPVFERSGRRVRPTATGDVVADYARRIVGLADEMSLAVADLEGLRTGRLIIGASSTVGEQMLPEVLGHFHRVYPGVQLTLRIGNTGEVAQAVVERDLDLGIVGHSPRDRALTARPVFDDALEVFVTPEHPLTTMQALRVADLNGATFVLREAGSATHDLALHCLAAGGCIPGEMIELGSNEAVKRAVSVGLGIGILSTHTVAVDRRAGLVTTLPIVDWTCRRQFWLIYRHDRRLSRAEQAFITMMTTDHETTSRHRTG